MKITQFDKQNLQSLRAALAVAHAKIEQDFGVKVEVGSITFTATSFKCAVTAVLSESVSDPYLAGVPAAYVTNFNRYVFKNKLLSKVKTSETSPTYVIVGMRGKNLIGKIDGQPNGGMYKLEFRNGNYLYCQVTGQKYSKDFDQSFSKFSFA